jgi:SRSO17 transposase
MREDVDEFDAYLGHLGQALGHADRHAGLKGYCSGLVLPLSRSTTLWPRQTGLTVRSCSGYANG